MVPISRMAKVLGARPADVLRLGRSMGLENPPRISRNQQARSYITVIRHNWHLLSYEQLLQLLDWTPEQMAYTLREDDFLFIKLGSLKPKCEPLHYQEPGPAGLDGEKKMAQILREEFPRGVMSHGEPLFGFIHDLESRPAYSGPLQPGKGLRYCYSYYALYGDPLLEKEADPYPDGLLARLARAGVTGVWLQAVLFKLAPFPWDSSLSDRYQERLKNLKTLVARAQKHGIRLFLYLNEPRSMPLRFFETHSQLKGVVQGDHAALCTSVPEVQKYIEDSIASICRAVPDLGGFFSITASENFTNCWSHGTGKGCPHCGSRAPAEVIAEVNALFQNGIRRAGTSARLLAWDWGWNDSWAEEAIKHLPKEVTFMSVSEWQLPVERGGIKTEVGEYSISAVGPGPRAQRHWKWAQAQGLKTAAKIQAGNTWELSAVPYIPAVENVARHAENLHKMGTDTLMLGWTLGGYPSPNLEVVSETLECSSGDEAMNRVAIRRYGAPLAEAVVTAWRGFSKAFREYPYHGGLLYNGPQQMGPANLLWAAPTGYHATMVGFPYDDLDGWRAVYPPEVFVRQFNIMADGFEQTLDQLKQAVANVKSSLTNAQCRAVEGECRVAEAVAIHFRSSANQGAFVLARRAVAAAKNASEAKPHIDELERLLKAEIVLAHRLYELQSVDSRLGFEATNQYYFVPIDLVEKVLNCRQLLDEWLPRLRRTT